MKINYLVNQEIKERLNMKLVQNMIVESKKDMRRILRRRRWPVTPIQPNKDVVANYTAAIAVNFTDWMGKTLLSARHELSRYVLMDNLRCESAEDHVGMLLDFAKSCNVFPHEAHYNNVANKVARIRRFFSFPHEAGLSGMALMTVLENTSEVFIPVLEKIAVQLGSTNRNIPKFTVKLTPNTVMPLRKLWKLSYPWAIRRENKLHLFSRLKLPRENFLRSFSKSSRFHKRPTHPGSLFSFTEMGFCALKG